MTFKYRALDSRLQHRAPASAAQTATATVETLDQTVAMRTEFVTKIYLEAIAIDGNDESYTFTIELSDDNFSTVNEVAAIRDFGATEVRVAGAPDSVAGDIIEMFWASEVNGIAYRYWRLRCTHAGATSSITYHAYSSVLC